MRKLQHIFCMTKLIILKWLSRGAIKFCAPLHTYQVAADTKLEVIKGSKVILGRCSTRTNVHLVSWGGVLSIGNGCSFNRNVIIVSRKQIIIGDGTVFGPNVCIYDHDHAFGPTGMIKNQMNYGTVRIGNNVWIGAGVIVLKNTIIGDNCVIGAGCIVSGNIPEGSLVTSENRNIKIERLHDKRNKKE